MFSLNIFTIDWVLGDLEPSSALHRVLLKVKSESILPNLELAVLLEGSIHHPNANRSQISRAGIKIFCHGVDSQTFALEQNCIDQGRIGARDELKAIIKETSNLLVGFGS